MSEVIRAYSVGMGYFEGSAAAAAAAGVVTNLTPRAPAPGSIFAPSGTTGLLVTRPAELVAVRAAMNMAAAVRLATAAGAEAWRDAVDGLEVRVFRGTDLVLDGVSLAMLMGGPPSILITTAVDTWTPVTTALPVPIGLPGGEQALTCAVVQQRISTVAIADIQVGLLVRG